MNQNDASAGLLDKAAVVTSLHAILKPFLLRRLKVDVEKSLPPKKEYLLYAPLTAVQKEGYQAIVQRRMREYLVNKKMGDDSGNVTMESTPAPSEATDDSPSVNRARRAKSRVNYHIEESDSAYLEKLENGTVDEPNGAVKTSDLGEDFALKQASTSTYDPTDNSQTSQQHEAAKPSHAAAQNLVPPVPLRLADRPCHRYRGRQSRSRQCQWQNAPAQPSPRCPPRAGPQGFNL
jgi:SNF2 family DNA or RNA helicase